MIKKIRAWIIQEESEKGRSYYSEKFYGFSNYGYQKSLWIIDYAHMRHKSTSLTFINCDGSVIRKVTDDPAWDELLPGSLAESIVKKIMEKYNLK